MEMIRLWLCILSANLGMNIVIGQSLAKFKPVTMSSQYDDWTGSRAVDGYYGYGLNLYSCACCSATSTATNFEHQWLEIDLGETQTFTRIVVHGRTDNDYARQNLTGLTIYLDDAATSIASIPDTGQGHVRFYNFDLGKKYSAQKIKLVLERDNAVLVLCEVDVFNDSHISNGAVVAMSSQFDNWTAARAVDGQLATHATDCGCCSATQHQTDPWLNVDLGDTFLITYIQMYGRTDKQIPSQSFEGVRIDIDSTAIDTIPTGSHVDYYEVFPVPEKIGRQIRLTTIGAGRILVMCELVIYGERVVSIKRDTEIRTQYNDWTASRAVDGDYRTLPHSCFCCTATDRETNPMLRVDLGPGYTVSRVVIYGRTDAEYNGQSFSDMTISLETTVVHTIPTSTAWIYFYGFQLSSVQQATSVTLTLVGSNKQLVVCEVLVYGDCIDGYFGTNCDRQCHCEGATCPTISGICPSGRCFPGYGAETCSEECEIGNYGHDCAMVCSSNCKYGRPCNHITGHCEECEPGYTNTDPFCRTPCDNGRYGNNCAGICGKCRDGPSCNFVTGYCVECDDGFKYSDVFCKTACDGGTYGTNCIETCGKCRNGDICNTVNGMCTECMDGYTTTDRTCKTPCLPGTYGQNCGQQCGSCTNTPCHHVTGVCDDCMDGLYVFSNKLCNTACDAYTYGYNCTERCGNCRNNASCDPVNGDCAGCEDGYPTTDSRCKTACPAGTFGSNCQNDCGMCKSGDVCDRRTGTCPDGCSDGYQGDQCLQMTHQSEESDTSTSISIPIFVGAIVASVLVTFMVMLMIMLWRSRLYKRTNNRKETAPSNVLPTPSQTASHYEGLQLSTIGTESPYAELQ